MPFGPTPPGADLKPLRLNSDVTVISKARRYAAVGKCIYCGCTKDLSDEHIFAESLGGNWELLKSSCKECREITSSFELKFTRHSIWPIRLHMKLPQKKRRKPRQKPKNFEIAFKLDDGEEFTVDIPIGSYPNELFLYKLAPCHILHGTPPNPGAIECREWRAGPPLEHIQEGLRPYELAVRQRTGRNVVGVYISRMHLHEFMQTLAKIAHSYAIAELGLSSFEPMLTDFIRGERDENIANLIGGTFENFDEGRDVLHNISLKVREINGIFYLIAYIRMFAILCGAEYHLIVGRLTNEQGRAIAAYEETAHTYEIKVSLTPHKPMPGARIIGMG